ncbi:hypothetical protein NUH86_20125 [Sphingobium sp. JS3065]|jgi:acyl-CoA hydrolase|uniref:acetyl-CoA hydrolase/transferase family protein n=1 Tax=Sphingobium sp. JS3065 TaxID=2970925 RepID=UPI002264E2AC|nr:acetyl-CoA hydrolase/transferase C-terminal domain-containing protein [Sphingobium sp. JS3065]UZW57059.1 hypothetical protein NUH86_20125 [Sphingobium sp. JS3065]
MIFRKGERLFIPGAAGEPTALVKELFGAAGLDITTSVVPGINPLKSEAIGPGTQVTGLFMQPSLSEAQRSGSFRHIPQSYAAMLKQIEADTPFDWCVVQVSPPDGRGRCSLGPAAEFAPAAMQRARRIFGVINPFVPVVPNAPFVEHARLAGTMEADTPIVTYAVGEVDSATHMIAKHIAGLIPDGAAIQVGLGKVPHALMQALHGHRRLRIHSGMISDGIIGLMQAGALDESHAHRTTAVLGSPALYEWLDGRSDIHVRGVEEIHLPSVLAGVERLFAVNSALEVDLLGQCNLEHANGRAVSGGGGASDFARGARLGRGGVSIIALPATFGAAGSRICPRLSNNAVATISRNDVDIVVTEEGIADLRGKSVHERAKALIGVAAPGARDPLSEQWAEIAGRL